MDHSSSTTSLGPAPMDHPSFHTTVGSFHRVVFKASFTVLYKNATVSLLSSSIFKCRQQYWVGNQQVSLTHATPWPQLWRLHGTPGTVATDNVENVQVFPFRGFVWLYSINKYAKALFCLDLKLLMLPGCLLVRAPDS